MQTTADTALGYMKAWGNKAKQYALNLTDIEIKTEQATNNDPWGPHGTAMGGEIGGVFDASLDARAKHPAHKQLEG